MDVLGLVEHLLVLVVVPRIVVVFGDFGNNFVGVGLVLPLLLPELGVVVAPV